MINILRQWYQRYFTDPQTVMFAFILIFGALTHRYHECAFDADIDRYYCRLSV